MHFALRLLRNVTKSFQHALYAWKSLCTGKKIMVSTPAPSAPATLDRELPQHTLVASIALHLVPGALGTLFYVLTAPIAMRLGFPPLLAIYTAIVVIITFELGYLFAHGKQHTGRLSLRDIVLYKVPLPVWQYTVLVPVVLAWAILA